MFLYFASFLRQDPPLWLSVDKPSTSGIGLDKDGVWIIVSGTFCSLDVVLTNAIGQPVHKDVKVHSLMLSLNFCVCLALEVFLVAHYWFDVAGCGFSTVC